jgi:hypothetical protein
MYEHYRHLIRDHVYDKCWQLDITWTEVLRLVDTGFVIEEHDLGETGVKAIRLLLGWSRPLHLVYVVNDAQRLVVYRTIYEPDLQHWKPGFRERRR